MFFAVINPISFKTHESGIILGSSSVNVQLRIRQSDDNPLLGEIFYAAGSPLYAESGSLGVINHENLFSLNENSVIGFIFGETFGFSTNGDYSDSQVTRNFTGSSTYNQIGMRVVSEEPFDGFIGEIIIINSVEDSDRQKIEGYLAHKWGLSTDLPSDHPHKDNAP